MSEDEILNHIEKHRYFSFTKDDLPRTKKSLDNLRIFGLTEPHGENSIRLTRDGLNALKVGFENWVNQNIKTADTMAHELHEQILFYLYKFKSDKDYHDILDEFTLHTFKVLSGTIEELQSKGLVENEIYLTFLEQERKRRLKSRITISGIEYVNNMTKTNNDREGQTLIFHGNVGTVQNLHAVNSSGNSQSSDSSSNKSINEPKQNSKKPINIKTIIKYVFWVLGAILTVYGIYEMLVKWKII
jgi:hypothetical protein